MLDINNIVISNEILLNLCNDIITENKKSENEISLNDTCLKMIDYLMF